jgi:hypothetical protein
VSLLEKPEADHGMPCGAGASAPLERVPRILRAGCGRPGGCCIDTI